MAGIGDDLVTYDAYWPTCREERAVMRTVPWQDDVCVVCGASVGEDEGD